MIIGVIGTRTFNNYKLFSDSLKLFAATEIISRGMEGTDLLSQQYATENQINIKILKDKIELSSFVEYCHHVVAFWDGKSKGTGRTIDKIREAKIPLTIIWI